MKPEIETDSSPHPQSLDVPTSLKPAIIIDPVILQFYEPTSVLDPNLTSSPAVAPEFPSLPCWDLPDNASAGATEDWSFLLSEKDDFAPLPLLPASPFPEFDPNPPSNFDAPLPPHHAPPPPPVFDRAFLDLLIRAAHSVESNDFSTAQVILARLNHLFPSVSGSPLQRSALYFKDSLFSLLSEHPMHEQAVSPVDLVRRISAHKALSDLSPVPQFASFTANQTLLEVLSGAQAIHLIDFDLGLGGQWSSFAQEIAARARAALSPPPPIRLTAVVADDTPEAALAADNLRDFARGLGLRFSVDLVRVAALGTLALNGVRLSGGEAVAVVLTPAIFRLLASTGGGATDAALLRFVRRVAPRAVVFVDTEPGVGGGGAAGASFKRGFAGGIEFYSAVIDSLEAAAAATGAGDDPVRRIERFLMKPRILASVQSCGARPTAWREVFMSAGFAPAPFSEFTESQAEWLLRRAPVDGFHVERKDGALVLSWRGRDVAATSAWRC